MRNSETAVLMDSGCDITDKIAEQYDIHIMPLTVVYHDRSYSDASLDGMYVYEHFKEEIPKTSALNMNDVSDMVRRVHEEGYRKVICICISSAMSSTYDTVNTALQHSLEEGLIDQYFVFDTRNISIGSGIFAIYAGKLLLEGASFEDVKKKLKEKIRDSHLCFYMDTLTYLAKGGRITPSVAFVGNVLNLKPIIACNEDGRYYTVAKTRGTNRGVLKLVDLLITPDITPENSVICIMNGDGLLLAEKAKELIEEKMPHARIIMEKQIVPSMAIHTGPGLLGIEVFHDAFPL